MRCKHRTKMFASLLSLLACSLCASVSTAQEDMEVGTTQTIELSRVDEDGEDLLYATVTADDEPVEGVMVTFTVIRTFGAIVLGREETFDDGTAAVEFPLGIPGDADGHFTVVASIDGDDEVPSVSESKTFTTDARRVSAQSMFPGALWSQRPLWPLIAVIAVLFTGVWSTYAFVIVQLVKLHGEGT